MKNKETPLVEPAVLKRLSSRFKLGVVTGRPRRDALCFLEKFGLRHLFGAIVTMEQAPLKPSPEPVRLALRQLSVEGAWMVGDTPDDMRSARAAGVLPLAVFAPADNPSVARPALIGAGACRVLTKLEDIEELLP
jgi:phosphoglycolate phosphatase-like HAD superfamily hydrolase